MNEERLEREKNKRIKLNGSTSSEIAANSQSSSQSHSPANSHPTSSANGNGAAARKVANGSAEKQEGSNPKEVAKLHPKMSKLLSISGKRIQKELSEIIQDPPPNCRYAIEFNLN